MSSTDPFSGDYVAPTQYWDERNSAWSIYDPSDPGFTFGDTHYTETPAWANWAYNYAGDTRRIRSELANAPNYWGGAGSPQFYAYQRKDAAGNWQYISPGEHAENENYFWTGVNSPEYTAAYERQQAGTATPLDIARLNQPSAIGHVMNRGDLVALNPMGAFASELGSYERAYQDAIGVSDAVRQAMAIQESQSTPQAQAARSGDSDGLGLLGGLIGTGIGFATGMPWLGGAIGGGLSSGDLEGALTGGLLGFAGGQLFGGATGGADTGYIDALGGMTDATGTALGGWSAGGTSMFDDYINTLGDWATGGDDYINTLGDWATSTATSGMTSSEMMNLMGDFLVDDKIQVLTNMGIPESVATSIAPSLSNDVLQGVINASSLGISPTSILKTLTSGGSVSTGAGLLGGGLNTLAGLLQSRAAQSAATNTAQAQIEAARIAAEAAKFKPVGVTTRFGSSNFGYDALGNLTSAGYTMSPELKAQQDALMAASGGMLNQFTGAQAATAPMGTAAQRAMQLGQGYLGTDPAAQAAKYYAEQQALLAPTRERQFSSLENRLLQQGRLGLATGATSTGLGAANPELEAFYNAQRMQDLGLAAQATQGGMDYAKFGAGMVGTGGDLLKGMYGTQAAAYAPYQTALGGAQTLEQMAQQPMDIGTAIGAKTSTAAANAGQLTAQGMLGAAQTNQAAAYSPWASLLAGGANALNTMNKPQTVYVNPLTGQPMNWGV